MNTNPLGVLDNIRLSNGEEGLKRYFEDLYRSNRSRALELLNDAGLTFGTLFVLSSMFSEDKIVSRHKRGRKSGNRVGANVGGTSGSPVQPLLDELIPTYREALNLARELTGRIPEKTSKNFRIGDEKAIAALRWILQTGYSEDGMSKPYERLLERSAALLAVKYRDSAILPELSELIFERHRKGKLIHDLVWSFFEERNPEGLLLIAQKLHSGHPSDVILAHKLLHFIPDIRNNSEAAGSALSVPVYNWLSENMPFLHYTGESMQLCSRPEYYEVAWQYKYLCHPVSADTGQPLQPLNTEESEIRNRFLGLAENWRQKLADFSFLLYRRNIYQWNIWIRLPVKEQMNMAAQMTGGLA